MNEESLLQGTLLVGGILFAVGLTGFIVRRNVIVMFLCLEMMLQGVSLTLAAFGRYHGDWGGQMLVIFIITVAACEAGIGLALILMLVQRSHTLDAVFWQSLREESEQPFVDHRVPEIREEEHVWPTLTPAGIRPVVDEEQFMHRPRV